jgi:hypothetical protein
MKNIFLLIISVIKLSNSSAQTEWTGTFEFHAKGVSSDWFRLTLKPDSSFIFEMLDYKSFDSIGLKVTDSTAIANFTDKGRWKYSSAQVILYDLERTDPISPEYTYLVNSKWRFKKGKIYSDDPFRKRIYFNRIK